LLLALLVTFNSVLVAWGSPAPAVDAWVWAEGRLPGAGGLAVLAWMGLVVIAIGATSGRISRIRWGLIAAVGVWISATAVGMLLHGTMRDARFWYVAAAAVAVAVAGALTPFG